MAGTRILRIDLGGIVKLQTWPMGNEASIRIIGNRLPPDAKFVKIARIEGEKVFVVVSSATYVGHEGEPVKPPLWITLGNSRRIDLPSAEELKLTGRTS